MSLISGSSFESFWQQKLNHYVLLPKKNVWFLSPKISSHVSALLALFSLTLQQMVLGGSLMIHMRVDEENGSSFWQPN